MHTCNAPRLDARLAAAYDFVRPGHAAADIGCDHGKLSAALAGSGRCPLVLACDLRPGPLEKARVTCAPYGDKVQCRLGSGLSVLEPGEVDDIIIAGMGAETIIEILEAAPWVFDARYNLVLVPATKHSILRRWLARRGFALRAETLCQAAGRWYAVMNAQYTGAAREPDGLFCLTGLTNGQPGCSEYYAVQNEKLKKYRLGLPEGTERDAVGELIAELDALAARYTPAGGYKIRPCAQREKPQRSPSPCRRGRVCPARSVKSGTRRRAISASLR